MGQGRISQSTPYQVTDRGGLDVFVRWCSIVSDWDISRVGGLGGGTNVAEEPRTDAASDIAVAIKDEIDVAGQRKGEGPLPGPFRTIASRRDGVPTGLQFAARAYGMSLYSAMSLYSE